jgi:hypothetical protein
LASHVPAGAPLKLIGHRPADDPLIAPLLCHDTPWSSEYERLIGADVKSGLYWVQ